MQPYLRAHQPSAWAYGADNELLQWGTGAEQTRLRYNASGNLLEQSYAGQTRTHRYDATDRLVGIGDEQGSSARYAYDPLGRRIRKTVGTGTSAVTTWYVYSDEGLIAELDGQGTMKRSYGWVPDAMWGTAPLWQAEASTGDEPAATGAVLRRGKQDALQPVQGLCAGDRAVLAGGSDRAVGRIDPAGYRLCTLNNQRFGAYNA